MADNEKSGWDSSKKNSDSNSQEDQYVNYYREKYSKEAEAACDNPRVHYGWHKDLTSAQSNVERVEMANTKTTQKWTEKCEQVALDVGHRIEKFSMAVGHRIENYASDVGHRIENFACPDDQPAASKQAKQ